MKFHGNLDVMVLIIVEIIQMKMAVQISSQVSYFLLFHLLEWAPGITNRYGNPQKWVAPWFGVLPQAQEQF